MKIYTAGLPVKYVDEAPPVHTPGRTAPVEVSVEDAIRLAQARAGVVEVKQTPPPKTEVLEFTRGPQVESPLIDNSKGVSNPDNISGRLEHGTVENPVVPTGTTDVESDPLTK